MIAKINVITFQLPDLLTTDKPLLVEAEVTANGISILASMNQTWERLGIPWGQLEKAKALVCDEERSK